MLSSQAGIPAPTLTVMQGFEAKKDSFVHFFPSSCILHHIFTSHLQIEPACGWLVAEHDNHYTAQLATMQCQTVVFKPNVRENGNGSCVSVCMTSFYFPNYPFLRKHDLICLTPHLWQHCISQYYDITKRRYSNISCRLKVDLHSIRKTHFYTFFTYVKRIRFSVRKRSKTNTQISHALYAHSICNFSTFLCKFSTFQ